MVIKLLWESEGTIDFHGQFFHLEHARLDTELYQGKCPPIWIGAAGPRMLEITGRFADGWWPAGAWTPEDYAAKLGVIRAAADRAGRDPMAITPAFVQIALIAGDDAELAEIVSAPLIKALTLQFSAADMRLLGLEHPMGPQWRGYQDINPGVLTRERVLKLCDQVTPEMILAMVPHGTPGQVAARVKEFVDAGLRVPKILDYGGMAGQRFGAQSAAKVRSAEDELLRLCEGM